MGEYAEEDVMAAMDDAIYSGKDVAPLFTGNRAPHRDPQDVIAEVLAEGWPMRKVPMKILNALREAGWRVIR